MQKRLDALEILGRDYLRHFDRNPFVLGPRPARAAIVGIVVIDTGIGVARQDGVYDAHIIWIAVAIAESAAIHPGRYILDAHRPLGAVALEKQPKYLPHGGGFLFLDFQTLLDFLAALFGLDGAIAERRLRTVPKSLPRIFQHGPRDMLGGLFAAILIRSGQHGFRKICARSLSEILSHRNNRHAVFFELAFPEGITRNVPEKSRLAMDQHHVNRRRVYADRFHHALELRPLIIPCAGTGIDIFRYEGPAFCRAEALSVRQLIRDRNIVVRLSRGRDTRINSDTFGHFGNSCWTLDSIISQSSNSAAITSISICATGESFDISTFARNGARPHGAGVPSRLPTGFALLTEPCMPKAWLAASPHTRFSGHDIYHANRAANLGSAARIIEVLFCDIR